jgi:hypothetical protein
MQRRMSTQWFLKKTFLEDDSKNINKKEQKNKPQIAESIAFKRKYVSGDCL